MLLPQHDATISHAHCSRAHPCKRFRECQDCAAARQRYIADAAERLQKLSPDLTWTILAPQTQSQEAISQARSAWVKQTRPKAALWTVEIGHLKHQLHLNILHPPGPAYAPRSTNYWSAPLKSNARAVAAYGSKPSGFPPLEIYDGRLFGACGPLWQFLTSDRQHPLVVGAAVNHALSTLTTGANQSPPPTQFSTTEPLSRSEYAAIAARHLPHLLHNLRKTQS